MIAENQKKAEDNEEVVCIKRIQMSSIHFLGSDNQDHTKRGFKRQKWIRAVKVIGQIRVSAEPTRLSLKELWLRSIAMV